MKITKDFFINISDYKESYKGTINFIEYVIYKFIRNNSKYGYKVSNSELGSYFGLTYRQIQRLLDKLHKLSYIIIWFNKSTNSRIITTCDTDSNIFTKINTEYLNKDKIYKDNNND